MLTMSQIDPETVGQLLGETARVWRQKLDQRLQPLGLSQAKWRTIALLARGHLTQRDLAERLSIEEPTLARLLTRLEREGWIKRQNSRHDRRCKTVHLQPKSSQLYHQIDDAARDLRHELLKTIPPRDLQTFVRVLAEIRHKAVEAAEHLGNGNGLARRRRQTT